MDITTENRGRPTVITPEIANKLLASFQRGLSVTTACDLAGIGTTAFYDFQRLSVEFAERVKAARAYGKSLASDIVLDVLIDHERVQYDENTKRWHGGKYSHDQRVNTAKWWLEKQEPEMFGKVVVNQNNNQNNFFLLNHGQLSQLSKQPDIDNSDPTKLLEALEGASKMDAGTEERRTMELHSSQIQDQNSASQGM